MPRFSSKTSWPGGSWKTFSWDSDWAWPLRRGRGDLQRSVDALRDLAGPETSLDFEVLVWVGQCSLWAAWVQGWWDAFDKSAGQLPRDFWPDPPCLHVMLGRLSHGACLPTEVEGASPTGDSRGVPAACIHGCLRSSMGNSLFRSVSEWAKTEYFCNPKWSEVVEGLMNEARHFNDKVPRSTLPSDPNPVIFSGECGVRYAVFCDIHDWLPLS